MLIRGAVSSEKKIIQWTGVTGYCMILIDIIQYSLLYSQTQDLIEIMANKSYDGKYNIIVVYHVIVPFKNPTGAIPL